MKYLKRFNESNSNTNIESYLSELINVLKEDNFLFSNKVIIYQRTPINGVHGGYLFKLKYKNIRLEVNKFPAYFSIVSEYDGMSHHPKISPELNESLYKLIMKAYINRYNIVNTIMFKLDLTYEESVERIEEFDIIENSEVNLISLNSLFDYYNITFDLKDMISIFRSRNIPYTEPNKLLESNTEDNKIEDITKYLNDTLFIEDMVINNTNVVKKSEFKFKGQDVLIYYSHSSNLKISFDNINLEVYDSFYQNLHRAIINNVIRRQFLIGFIMDEFGITLEEATDRITEFELVRHDMVDLISLESLCGYYETEFPKEYAIEYLSKHSIKYIE